MNDNIKAGADIHAGDGGYSLGTQEKYDEFVKGRNQSLGNMRIKQLAEQAGAIEAKDITNIPRALSLNGEEIEKFAELIIRECTQYTDSDIRKFILNHFGVEE
jgi:hypothetical protein